MGLTYYRLIVYIQCKKLVLEYGPLILANAEKFLEATDICTSIHACKKSQQVITGSILADAWAIYATS